MNEPARPRLAISIILFNHPWAALSCAAATLGWALRKAMPPGRPRMTIQAKLLCAIAVSGFAALAATSSAQALTTQECSAKYQAAKAAGTLGGQKWNDFRKAQCGVDATAAPAAAPAVAPGAPAAPAAPKAAEAKAKKEPAPAAAPAAPAGPAMFPSAV